MTMANELAVLLAKELAAMDGHEGDEALQALRWSGGVSPEPLGNAWDLDYLPKGRRLAAVVERHAPAPLQEPAATSWGGVVTGERFDSARHPLVGEAVKLIRAAPKDGSKALGAISAIAAPQYWSLLALINDYGRACRRDGNPAWESKEGQALKAAMDDALPAAPTREADQTEPAAMRTIFVSAEPLPADDVDRNALAASLAAFPDPVLPANAGGEPQK